MTRHGRRVLFVAALGLIVWVDACSDSPCSLCPPPPAPNGLIVSDPLITSSSASTGTQPRLLLAGDSTVYVALLPGTAPGGSQATIHVVGALDSVFTSVIDGGFDPVPVVAAVGDSIEVVVTDAGGAVIRALGVPVKASRPPVVVRTDPPPRKRDVPLNAVIVVVFSEPVAGSSLTASSVRLTHGSTPVAGTVGLLQGTATAAVFTPATLLDANTDYRLVVTRNVRDFSGDALAAEATVEFTTGTTTVGTPSSVSVTPDTTAVQIGSQVQLRAIARDDSARWDFAGRPVIWSSDNAAVAPVSSTGLVTALGQGVAHIQATIDGVSGSAVVISGTLASVASVEIKPESALIVIDGFVELAAVLRDVVGNVLPYRPIAWQSSAPAVASVTDGPGGKALVTGVSAGAATITATSEGKSATARVTVGTIGPFSQISGSCALATDGTAWCWGSNVAGQRGNGTLLGAPVPTAVAGGLRFSRIGGTCALTTDSAAYCWGTNWYGELGIGSAAGPEVCPDSGQCSTVPVLVAGGHRFSAIDGNVLVPFNCALAQNGDAYCWGNNEAYQLGLGTRTGPEYCPAGSTFSCSTVPAKVAGGFTFTAVSAGRLHACALTASGAAYCWGVNYAGQLGDGTTSDRTSPVPVLGGHTFVAITAGYEHTCALTAEGSAYCWGYGPLGGSSISSWVPIPVAGTLTFAAISAGIHLTCGLTTTGAAYCWGATPAPVAGGYVFATVDAGETACAVTTAGVAYCWDGSNVPIKVPGQP